MGSAAHTSANSQHIDRKSFYPCPSSAGQGSMTMADVTSGIHNTNSGIPSGLYYEKCAIQHSSICLLKIIIQDMFIILCVNNCMYILLAMEDCESICFLCPVFVYIYIYIYIYNYMFISEKNGAIFLQKAKTIRELIIFVIQNSIQLLLKQGERYMTYVYSITTNRLYIDVLI